MSVPQILPGDLIYQYTIDEIPPPPSNPDAYKPVPIALTNTDILSSPVQGTEFITAHAALVDYIAFQAEKFAAGTYEPFVLFGCNVTKVNNDVVNISRGSLVVPNVGVFPVIGGNMTLTGYLESSGYTGLLLIGLDSSGIFSIDTVHGNVKCYICTIIKHSGIIVSIHHTIQNKLQYIGRKNDITRPFVLGESFISSSNLLGEKQRQYIGPFILGESILATGCWLGNGH